MDKLNYYMEKGKKIYNLIICFDEADDVCEYLAEEMYIDTLLPEEALVDEECIKTTNAPSNILKEFVDKYYEALCSGCTIMGIS